jgi:DNA-binding transcriptional ArsR family regulator
MRDIVTLTKALGDETRIRILMLLQEQELCVCQILDVFDLAGSTLSKHLSVLYQAGLVQSHKKGRWVYYRLAGEDAPETVQCALCWLQQAAQEDPQVLADRTHLKSILCLEPEELCQRR